MAITETGTYVVRVTATDLAKDGQYVLDRACLPSGPAPVHLGCGSLAPGAIRAAGQTDNFTFYAFPGDEVELTLVQSGWPGGAFARATLSSPTGSTIRTINANSITPFSLTETGTYSLAVFANNLVSGGSYKLGLECRCPVGPIAAHLVPGDLLQDSISTWGESDWFTFDGTDSISTWGEVDYVTFEGTAGMQLDLMATQSGWPGGAAATVSLYSPSCVYLGTFSANNTKSFNLTETGTYAIRVRASNYLSVGNYTLTANCP